MKKILLISFAITYFISSCKKDVVDVPTKETESQTTASDLVYWDDLPDEYKNAVRVSPEKVVSEREVLPNENGIRDEVFNPFNLASENFSITIPPYHLRKIAIGQGKNGAVSHISIWYHIGHQQNIVYVVSSGATASTPMVTYTPSTGEYIRGFSGRSEGGVLKGLTIYTSKGNVSSSSGTTGIYFSFFATPGSFIGKFSGNTSTMVNQLKATSYFFPWQKLPGSNARDISIDDNGTAYMADAAGRLYRMANTANIWSRIIDAPRGVTNVAAYEGGYLCVIANNGRIYNCDKITHAWSERELIIGATDIAMNGSGQIFLSTTAGIFYNNNNLYDPWIPFATGSYKSVSCGKVLNIRAIDNSGNIFSFGIYREQMPGGKARDIHTAYDGLLWLTNTSGKISFFHYPSSTTWKEIAGSDAVRIAAIGRKVMMVNSQGEVYKLEY